jgi:hypothetical protein
VATLRPASSINWSTLKPSGPISSSSIATESGWDL